MLFILINKEDYDCYRVDVAYPIELNSKEEFWALFNAAKQEARARITRLPWESIDFKVMGHEYYCCDEERRPKLLTIDEWRLHGKRLGIQDGDTYRLKSEEINPLSLPDYIRTVEFKEFAQNSWVWQVEQSDEKGNWVPYGPFLSSEFIKDNYWIA